MTCELDVLPDLPSGYPECLEKIKGLIASKKNKPILPEIEEPSESFSDLASEFGFEVQENIEEAVEKSIQFHRALLEEGLNLYKIDLTLDTDCYKRGFDHLLFLNLVNEKAKSLESFFDMEEIPTLETFSSDVNGIKKVHVVVLTPQTKEEVAEMWNKRSEVV